MRLMTVHGRITLWRRQAQLCFGVTSSDVTAREATAIYCGGTDLLRNNSNPEVARTFVFAKISEVARRRNRAKNWRLYVRPEGLAPARERE